MNCRWCRQNAVTDPNDELCRACQDELAREIVFLDSDPAENDYDGDFEDDWDEPVGSCDECGTNLYNGDDPDLCEQCLWAASPEPGEEDDLDDFREEVL